MIDNGLEILVSQEVLKKSKELVLKNSDYELKRIQREVKRSFSLLSLDFSKDVRSYATDFLSSYIAINFSLSSSQKDSFLSQKELSMYSTLGASGFLIEKNNFSIDSSLSNLNVVDDYVKSNMSNLNSSFNSVNLKKFSEYFSSSFENLFTNLQFKTLSSNLPSLFFSSIFKNTYDVINNKNNSIGNKNSSIGNKNNSFPISKFFLDSYSFSPKKIFDSLNQINFISQKRTMYSKENEVQQKAEDKFDLDLRTIIIPKKDRVTYDQVQGNKPSKDFLTSAVKDLMLYNKKTNSNLSLEFGSMNNLALLAGDAGTGKTFTANYAISLATSIAQKYGLDFEAVKLSTDSSYQDGSVLMLKNQLEKISNSNKAQIVFLDDCENLFPSRSSGKVLEHKKQTINEFLHFTQGINGYNMKGNYLLIATANLPESIDKAILSRFGDAVFHCEGPITPDQKANVLKNNLSTAISYGFVDISDWSAIGEYAQKYDLKGRDLSNIAKSILRNSRSNVDYDLLYKNMSSPDKMYSLLKNSYQKITQDDVFTAIRQMANQSVTLIKAQESYEKSA